MSSLLFLAKKRVHELIIILVQRPIVRRYRRYNLSRKISVIALMTWSSHAYDVRQHRGLSLADTSRFCWTTV